MRKLWKQMNFLLDKRAPITWQLLRMICSTFWSVLLVTIASVASREPIRKTSSGRVRGFETESLPGHTVEIYLGIPYARPPVGQLRFEYPEEVEDWTDILNATKLPPACPQSDQDKTYIQIHLPGFDSESENCLYLNIYVPKVSEVYPRLPVFVWIHGGSNQAGMGAMLAGDLLAARTNIIVINLNYRLDALGFLSLGDDNKEFPGNLGLYDQLIALQWIHKNVEHFGGDPNRITLAGHSAGALNVGIHMVSPLTKGLFQSVILQSGAAISFWSVMSPLWRQEYDKRFQVFLNDIQCNFNDSKLIKSCLKQKTVKEIQDGQFKRVGGYPIRHPVVIDGHFLPEDPVYLLQNNRSHATSVLMGFTKDEGIYLLGSGAYDYSKKGTKMDIEFLQEFIGREFYHLGPRSNVALIVHEYVNWTDPTSDCLLIRSCGEMFGDRAFSAPLHRTANYLTKQRENSTYMYRFEFDLTEYETECEYWHGVPHGRDIFYLFGTPIVGHKRKKFRHKDRPMSEALMDMWGNFVKTGKLEYAHARQPLEPYNTKTKPYIRMLNSDGGEVSIEMGYNYKPRKMAFWNRLMVDRENIQEDCKTSGVKLLRSYLSVTVIMCVYVLLDVT